MIIYILMAKIKVDTNTKHPRPFFGCVVVCKCFDKPFDLLFAIGWKCLIKKRNGLIKYFCIDC